jgi:hypothetical protein
MTFKEWMAYIIGAVFVFTMIFTAPQLFPNDRLDLNPNKKISTQLWENANNKDYKGYSSCSRD